MQLLIVLVLYATLIAQSLSLQTSIQPLTKQPDPLNNSTELAARAYIPDLENNPTKSAETYYNPQYDVNPIDNDYKTDKQINHEPLPPLVLLKHPQRKPAQPSPFNNKSLSHSLSRQLFGCRYISEIVNIDQFSTWKASPTSVQSPPISQLSVRKHDDIDYTSLKAYELIDDYPGILETRAVSHKLPKFFDSRTKYYYCPNLQRVEDQGCNCKASWAIAPVSALADRICITSKGKERPQLSPGKLLSCCSYCTPGHGCEGGHSLWSWVYLRHSGTVTGGPYGSNEACQKYKIPPCQGKHDDSVFPTPKCIRGCDTKNHYFRLYTTNKSYAHKNTTIEAIQNDIFTNGPVTADMKLYEDFYCYKKGIYTHLIGEQVGVQTVKIIGWGEEREVKYWIAANSWGKTWGENGFFKIERGTNECNIEFTVTAGFPRFLLAQ